MSAARPAPARPGLGVDVVDVAGLRQRLAEQPALAGVLFTPRERAEAASTPDPVRRLAAGFAAKEAFVKALQRGLAAGGPDAWLQELEVTVDTAGAASLALGAGPSRRLASRGLGAPALAVAGDAHLAIATVVLVPRDGASVGKEGA
jgi:holo-[acyl-carrier protein] synthase